MELNFSKNFINNAFLKALNDSLEFGSDPFNRANVLFRPDGQLEFRIIHKNGCEDIHVFTEGLDGTPLTFDDEFTLPEDPVNCPLLIKVDLIKLRRVRSNNENLALARIARKRREVAAK